MSALKSANHPAQCDLQVKSKGIWGWAAFLWAPSTGVFTQGLNSCAGNEQSACALLFVSTFLLLQYKIASLAVTFRSMVIIYLLLVFVTLPTAKGIDA